MTGDEFLFEIPNNAESSTSYAGDPEVSAVLDWFRSQRRMEARFGQVFRKSIDEVLDGQRTGRYDLNVKQGPRRVEKTEKTYLGTKVEIVTRAEFELEYGFPMDYKVAGHPVDAKFSIIGQWEIPKEAVGHICLLMTANDVKGSFRVGILRTTLDVLSTSQNGDGKRKITAQGKQKISWLVPDGKLPANFLLQLDNENPNLLSGVFEKQGSGQLRVDDFFRKVQGRLVDRTTVVTVAMQKDGPKRVRDARLSLRDEGIVILGYRKPSPRIASDLGLPIPKQGFWVSTRLTELSDDDPRPAALINGKRWGIWHVGDAHVAAPAVNTDVDD
ncbi:NaeI family type II restriction endonuclease [Streptomyces sp. PT12]|uniref:NaeI family type II restriction endonuclease n=1 Tax=Streptomyces sp. PT12 TaxID=1510197 RepID=UPI000DE512AB|nr:NaeI family type II restriction endonuclease [Streptomyces sp. PT12]RBM06610.1 restriction endonuclease [Streptomyces sp. PT12]